MDQPRGTWSGPASPVSPAPPPAPGLRAEPRPAEPRSADVSSSIIWVRGALVDIQLVFFPN